MVLLSALGAPCQWLLANGAQNTMNILTETVSSSFSVSLVISYEANLFSYSCGDLQRKGMCGPLFHEHIVNISESLGKMSTNEMFRYAFHTMNGIWKLCSNYDWMVIVMFSMPHIQRTPEVECTSSVFIVFWCSLYLSGSVKRRSLPTSTCVEKKMKAMKCLKWGTVRSGRMRKKSGSLVSFGKDLDFCFFVFFFILGQVNNWHLPSHHQLTESSLVTDNRNSSNADHRRKADILMCSPPVCACGLMWRITHSGMHLGPAPIWVMDSHWPPQKFEATTLFLATSYAHVKGQMVLETFFLHLDALCPTSLQYNLFNLYACDCVCVLDNRRIISESCSVHRSVSFWPSGRRGWFEIM